MRGPDSWQAVSALALPLMPVAIAKVSCTPTSDLGRCSGKLPDGIDVEAVGLGKLHLAGS